MTVYLGDFVKTSKHDYTGRVYVIHFAVRTRGHGFAVVDLHGLQLDRTYATRAVAARTAKYFNAENQSLHTYGVAWYVEVDATDERDAIKKARKYLAPSYRTDWEPVSVDLIEPTEEER